MPRHVWRSWWSSCGGAYQLPLTSSPAETPELNSDTVCCSSEVYETMRPPKAARLIQNVNVCHCWSQRLPPSSQRAPKGPVSVTGFFPPWVCFVYFPAPPMPPHYFWLRLVSVYIKKGAADESWLVKSQQASGQIANNILFLAPSHTHTHTHAFECADCCFMATGGLDWTAGFGCHRGILPTQTSKVWPLGQTKCQWRRGAIFPKAVGNRWSSNCIGKNEK